MQPERRVIEHLDRLDIVFDFYLGQHGLKIGMPIRVAWHELSTSGMMGIEFLAHSQDFVERAQRYLCHANIAPQIKSRDTLDVNRDLYFKVVNISGHGMLLSTSLTNKHLLPGMVLEQAELFVPGEKTLSLCLTIQNTHKAPAQDYFYLGVAVTDKRREFEHGIAGYLSTMSPDFLQASQDQKSSQDRAIRKKRLKQGLTFRMISTDREYSEVLTLRHLGYGSKGKLKHTAKVEDQGEGLAQEGTIIGAYLSGFLVASMELRFGNSTKQFRTFELIPTELLPNLNLRDMVEVNRLVVHPRIQGTDVVMGMVQKAHAMVMAQGGKDILLLATNKLMPLYLKIGCTPLNAQAPHPTIPSEQLNAMVLTKEAFLDGRFLHPDTWEDLYHATNTYFEKLYNTSPRRQIYLEIGIDLSLSVLVNIMSQFWVYGALATAGRSLAFAALVLGLALPRRYAIRSLFSALTPQGEGQSRRHSWLEVAVDTIIGLTVAIFLQWLFYGAAATWEKAGGLTVLLYAVTMGRRYLLRRVFDKWTRTRKRSHEYSY